MRLVSTEEMRAIDTHAIHTVGIPSLVLMENAGLKTLFTLEKFLGGLRGKQFTIVCGKGNNGGDGLVIARHLVNNGVITHVFLLADDVAHLSADAAVNLGILRASGLDPLPLRTADDLARLRIAVEFSDCVLDAIFGTGFQGEISGIVSDAVSILNEANVTRVAIDIPSGVNGSSGAAAAVSFNAHLTVTLGAPKIGLFLPPGMKHVGEVWVADIGLPAVSFKTVSSSVSLLNPELVNTFLPARNDQAHKGIMGNVLLLAGSSSYPGAAVLCSYGALRSGAGLVTVGVAGARGNATAARHSGPTNGRTDGPADGPTDGPTDSCRDGCRDGCRDDWNDGWHDGWNDGWNDRVVSPTMLPDVVLQRFPGSDGGFHLNDEDVRSFGSRFRAVVAGPGWGRGPGRSDTLECLLRGWPGPLLLDADALNVLADCPHLRGTGQDLVLTPHLGEMARLCNCPVADIQQDLLGTACRLAKTMSATVVLKSAVTVVASAQGKVFVCGKPNSGLARGGSGDLLAGLLGGLMATGLPGLQAAAAGVFLHASAAEIARAELGADSMTISEVAAYLPRAFRRLRGEETVPRQP